MKLKPGSRTSTRSIRTLKYIFAAIVIALAIISFYTFKSFMDYGEEVKWRVHSNNVIRALQEVEVEVLNAEVGHRGYQLSRNPDYLEPYLSSRASIDEKLDNINDLVLDQTDQQLRLDTLEKLIVKQYAIVEEIVNEVNEDDPTFSDYEINLLAFGRENMEDVRGLIDRIEKAENKILASRISRQESQSKIVPALFVISNIIALGIIIYVFLVIYRLLKVRIQTETDLREKQIQLLEAERMVNMGNWSWNIENDSMEWSEGLYQIYEKPPLTFKPDYNKFLSAIPADERKEVEEKIARAVDQKHSYELYHRIKLDSNKIRHVHTIGNPKMSFENDLVGYFGVTQDITEQKNFQDQLLLKSDELKKSNEELEQFAYVASHDLQEPLRKIRAFGDRLLSKYSEGLEETGQDYINRMQNAAERMQVLINDLLAFSRVSRKDQEFDKHDLKEIVKEVLEDMETKINDSKAEVNVDDLPSIKCNYQEIKRLFLNLISNAIKFQKPDVPPVVNIRSEIVKGSAIKEDFPFNGNKKYVKISIKDNGIGFDKKHENKIFNIFQRLHGRSKYKGTGIGLAICRKIAANHEGTIVAHGEENEGAEFIVILPKNLNKKFNHERTEKAASHING